MSWRRILLLTAVLFAALAGATWAVLADTDAATRLVRRGLADLLAPPTSVAAVALDLAAGRIDLTDVRLDAADRGLTARIDRIEAEAGFGAGGDAIGVHAVRLFGVAIDVGPTWPTPADLLRRSATPGAPRAGAVHVPAITLRDGALTVRARAGGEPFVVVGLEGDVAPRRDGPGLAVQARGRLQEPSVAVAVAGVLDPATGALDLTADVELARCDDAALASVLRRLDLPPPEVSFAARAQSLRVRCERPAGGDLRASVAAELTAARASGAALPPLLTAADITVQASTADGGSARLRLTQRSDLGALDLTAAGRLVDGAPKFDVRLHGEDVRIDRDVVRALQSFEAGRQVVAALEPTSGRGDLELFVENPHERGGATDLDLRLRDVGVTFRGFGEPAQRVGFPLPLANASGRVRLRDRVLLLDDVVSTIAEHAGGGVVRVAGRVETDKPGGEDTSVDIAATGIAFTPELRLALATLLRDDGDLYDKLGPSGRADVRVAIRPRSELPDGWAVDIALTDAAMRWQGFPYRLAGLKGDVRARADGVAFDLAGGHGAGSLRMRGFLPLAEPAWRTRGFHADVAVADVALDDELRAAVAVLAPEVDEPWRRSAARGSLAGSVRVWRAGEELPLQYDAALTLLDVTLALPAAPWTAAALAGRVHIGDVPRGTRIGFDGVRGRLLHGAAPPADLALLGAIELGDGGAEDLAFVVRGLELDRQLGATLEELGALGQGAWQQLRPSGRVDLVCRHRLDGDDRKPLQLAVTLREVRSDAPMLPRPAERMVGVLDVDGGEVRFAELQARLGGAPVRVRDGRIRTLPAPDGRAEIAFVVDATGVPVDDGLANLFSGPLQRAMLQRQLLGRADIDGLRLRFRTPTGGGPTETTLGGRMRVTGLDITLGSGADSIVLEGLTGDVAIDESTVADAGGSLRGRLDGVGMRLFGQPFTDVDATFVADAERIEIPRLACRLHGGRLGSREAGDAAIRYLLPGATEPEGALAADVEFAEVDVNRFLAATGWRQPPYSGAAAGSIRLERLAGADVVGAAGAGELRLSRADLGVVPLFTAIYAQLPPADRPHFDALDLAWRVRDGAAEFSRLDVRSNVLAARGSGRLGFDGYLDVELTLAKLLGDSADPFVMPLLSYLAQNLVSFHLYGYLNGLRAENRWLNESAPPRRAVVPAPPAGRPRPTGGA
ncbi:MAG: hypothetical protein ACK56S_02035 [Planctomycetota bacterium]